MSVPAPEETGAEAPERGADDGPGVLGNLPRTRPSVRSPRRAAAEPEAGPEAAADEGGEEAGSRGREAEIEALARAGISLAGSAATLGLRAAGRAAAALRDAVERR